MENKKYKNAKIINDDVIFIEMEDGTKMDANILFTFNENGDQFVLYEINDIAYGAKIADDNSLKPIEEDEWELVERVFNEWQEDDDEEEDK